MGSALTAELLLLGDLSATLLKSGVEGMDLGQFEARQADKPSSRAHMMNWERWEAEGWRQRGEEEEAGAVTEAASRAATTAAGGATVRTTGALTEWSGCHESCHPRRGSHESCHPSARKS